ncbi:MAG: carbohydrate porin [Beijerinckiaceae bacterium]|nr:carbohydrate porin [Beijerinckiaceae bacterium]
MKSTENYRMSQSTRGLASGGRKALFLGGAAISAFLIGQGVGLAADLPSTATAPAFAPVSPGFSGPLASFAAPLAAQGITFHAVALDFAEYDPSLGLQTGHAANSAYIVEGVDFDLATLAGLKGTSLHFENVFFAGVENINIAPQIGDSQVGYQPPYTPRVARLSRATVEQKLADGKLDIEVGSTHPAYYYAKFNCSSINTCFQSVLYLDAGYTSYKFSVPGGNIAYQVTPTIYAQAGAFAVQTGANLHVGYDFPDERYVGTLAMAEVGSKTSFANDVMPYAISFTGFFNSSTHSDLNSSSAFTGTSRTASGTSGVVVQGEKIVWRKDNGADPADATPTALKIYGSFASSLDSTVPIAADMWVGATLMSPFVARPADTFGVKVNYEKLNANYAQYLGAANLASGGTGAAYSTNHFVFEANAHIQLPLGMGFEPVAQYEIHPDSYFNPLTPVHARDGWYLGGTFVVPIGVLLGIQSQG